MAFKLQHSQFNVLIAFAFAGLLMSISACKPEGDVELRRIKDVVVDATTEPVLKANAVLFNPNKIRMTLRAIEMDVFVDGKKAARIDQRLKTKVPAQAEFIVPLEVKLNLKELGFFDTLFSVLGGKKKKIHYKGSIRFTYKGVPVKIPVDYQDEIRVRI